VPLTFHRDQGHEGPTGGRAVSKAAVGEEAEEAELLARDPTAALPTAALPTAALPTAALPTAALPTACTPYEPPKLRRNTTFSDRAFMGVRNRSSAPVRRFSLKVPKMAPL